MTINNNKYSKPTVNKSLACELHEIQRSGLPMEFVSSLNK